MKIEVLFAAGALMALVCAAQAQSLGGIADISIVDRETGAVLSPHYYRGEYWVAGRPGARYSIQIHNRLGERLLAVASVDGVNVISGETAAWDQDGYVFDAGERYDITGWRKSDAQIAAFTFTASPHSYAERTGRPANVGVIGVALYRERQPQAFMSPPRQSPIRPDARAEADSSALAGEARSIPAPAPPAAADADAAPLNSLIPRAALEPKLGTGHGEREYSPVGHTVFVRMQPQPNEVIRIRYDSLENLLAMGVVRRQRPMPPTANPFPGAPTESYVPDPPG